MRVKVSFRVNRETGEVEEFLIEDIGSGTDVEPDHELVHDKIALEVGKVVERRPAPEQVVGGPRGEGGQLTYQPEELLPPVDSPEEARE
jgi:hypothetical protein